MIQSTKTIVLRTIKYGETSLIVNLYTELFGMQHCIVQGVRKANKNGSSKVGFFSIGSILQVTIYHQNLKHLQRIKDFQYDTIHSNIKTNVVKNAIAVLIMEVVNNTIQEPEPNQDLFIFLEDILHFLEHANDKNITWLPHYFCIQYAKFLGFEIHQNHSTQTPILHLLDGYFKEGINSNSICSNAFCSSIIHLLNTCTPENINALQLNTMFKRQVLHDALTYLQIHIPQMASLKSLAIFETVFGE